MVKRNKPCCTACAREAAGLPPADPIAELQAKIDEFGWTVISVDGDNPYQVGFSYTIGLELLRQPELITFGGDHVSRSNVLGETAWKVQTHRPWERAFLAYPRPGQRVQVRPVAEQWRDTHAKMTALYWDQTPYRLWQVRLPGRDKGFSRDGVCCTPPCQPLLDREEPWQPIEHDMSPLSTDALWHRVVDEFGRWEGRWEKLGALRLGKDLFVVRNVPFLASDVAVSDVVSASEESSGRLVIQSVVQQSVYRTVRVWCEAPDRAGEDRVDEALRVLADDDNVVWECSHWGRRHWTLAVAASRLDWAEDVLRPLLRDGLANYEVVKRAGA
jgi:hypothetical protein